MRQDPGKARSRKDKPHLDSAPHLSRTINIPWQSAAGPGKGDAMNDKPTPRCIGHAAAGPMFGI
jgi:hypothetical protein